MKGIIKRDTLYTKENTDWAQLKQILSFVMKHKTFRKVLDPEWKQYKERVKSKKFDQYIVNRIWRNFFLFTDEMMRDLKGKKKLKILKIYMIQIKKGRTVSSQKMYELYRESLKYKLKLSFK